MPASDFFKRLFQYARKAKIKFYQIERREGWTAYGLPDMRGFVPHLRRVNIYANSKLAPQLDFSDLWLVHDLMHIVFYDFARLCLSGEVWRDPARFFENHLASEAFAVLGLDYHFLSARKNKGLAVDLSAGDWSRFQSFNCFLPDMRSPEFCRTLTEYYLSGVSPILQNRRFSQKRPAALRRRYFHWIDHELRYGAKQRHYVKIWHDDLSGRKKSRRGVIIEGSSAAEPIWELIRALTKPDRGEWNCLTKELLQIRFEKNAFSHFPKYRGAFSSYDFRFTDMAAFSRNEIRRTLLTLREPSASGLFLFWQILSLRSPSELTKTELIEIASLARLSQEDNVDKKTWNRVSLICQKYLGVGRRRPDPLTVSTFFLP